MIGAKIGLSQFGPGAIFSQPMQSGRYYFVPNYASTATSAVWVNNTLRFIPFWVPNAITVQRIGMEVTSAGDVGSTMRLGIYADDGTGRPGSLLLDAGTINGNSATVQEIASLSLALSPGMYWAAGVLQNVTVTQPTFRIWSSQGPVFGIDAGTTMPAANYAANTWLQTGASGALPATATPASQTNLIPPRIFIKVN